MAISSVVITSAEVPVQSPAISQYAGETITKNAVDAPKIQASIFMRRRPCRSASAASSVVGWISLVVTHLVAQVLLTPLDVRRIGERSGLRHRVVVLHLDRRDLRMVEVERRGLGADARDALEVVPRRWTAGRPLQGTAPTPGVVDLDQRCVARYPHVVEERDRGGAEQERS